MTFGQKLMKTRKEKGLSQAQLGKMIGVHAGHLSRIENGQTVPSIDVLKKIISAIGVSADFLLNDDIGESTPVELKNKTLVQRLMMIDDLPEKDQEMLVYMIETVLTKKKIQDLISKEAA